MLSIGRSCAAIGEELLELDLEECALSCQNSPDFTSFLRLVCREHLVFFLIGTSFVNNFIILEAWLWYSVPKKASILLVSECHGSILLI